MGMINVQVPDDLKREVERLHIKAYGKPLRRGFWSDLVRGAIQHKLDEMAARLPEEVKNACP